MKQASPPDTVAIFLDLKLIGSPFCVPLNDRVTESREVTTVAPQAYSGRIEIAIGLVLRNLTEHIPHYAVTSVSHELKSMRAARPCPSVEFAPKHLTCPK